MKGKEQISCKLECMHNHSMCENYISDEHAIFRSRVVKAGQYVVMEEVECSMVGFVLSGEIDISTGGAVCQRVCEGQMFLIAAGDNFHGKVVRETHLMSCLLEGEKSLCNYLAVEQLQKHVASLSSRRKGKKKSENVRIPLLHISSLLLTELEVLEEVIQAGLSCGFYQELKRGILFIEVRAFYSVEELATFFAPLLGKDNEFKNNVLQLYSQVETAQELMYQLNMSPTVFKRKFRDTFGVSARQWLIHKKEQKLIRDILMTRMTVSELAEKYNFTTNYMTTFCRKRFGKSPSELRMDYTG